MLLIEIIKHFFKKQKGKTKEEINLEIGIEKWKDMKNVSQTFIYMLLAVTNIKIDGSVTLDKSKLINIATALVYSDRITINHILKCAETLRINDELQELIEKNHKIAIMQNDKMKAHIMNNLLDPDYVKYKKGTNGTGAGGFYFG